MVIITGYYFFLILTAFQIPFIKKSKQWDPSPCYCRISHKYFCNKKLRSRVKITLKACSPCDMNIPTSLTCLCPFIGCKLRRETKFSVFSKNYTCVCVCTLLSSSYKITAKLFFFLGDGKNLSDLLQLGSLEGVHFSEMLYHQYTAEVMKMPNEAKLVFQHCSDRV